VPDDRGRPGRAAHDRAAPADRRVVALIALLVLAVLVVNVASALLPGIDAALASLPIVMVLLVVGTLLVLGRTIRR
jgi:hypothetical protein